MKKDVRYLVYKKGNHYEIDDVRSVHACRIATITKKEADEIARLLNQKQNLPECRKRITFNFSEIPKPYFPPPIKR